MFLSINHIDIPFINGEYNYTSTAFYRLSTDHVYSDSSILLLLIQFILVSSSLANQIKSHLYTLPNNTICGVPLVIENEEDCEMIYESGWSSITVKEGYCDSLYDDLVISNNNCLQYIYLQDKALSNIQSVVLSNLTNLSLIRTDHSLTQASSLTLSSSF